MVMKKTIFFALAFSIGIFLLPEGFAQETFKFYQKWMPHGRSNNRVLDVAQDLDGFLWAITEKGLNRFDGYETVIFPNNYNFLLDDPFLLKSNLMIDSKNRIWTISGSLQPEIFDRENEQFLPIHGLNSVTSMAETTDGNFIFGTLSGQVFLLNFENNTRELVFAKPDQGIVSLLQNPLKQEEFYIIFKNQFGKINTQTREFKSILSQEESDMISFSSASIDAEGTLWIGTLENGLFVWNSSRTDTPINLLPALPEISAPILDIQPDSESNLWIATYGSGVYIYNPLNGSVQRFIHEKSKSNSLLTNDITAIFQDYSGTVWLATLGAGLNYHDPLLDKYEVLSNAEVPSDIHLENIRALFVDSSKKLWIGSAGNGLYSFDYTSSTWKSFLTSSDQSPRVKENRILSLNGTEEQIWIGYQNDGLSILSRSSNSIRHFNETTEPALPAGQIIKIVQDAQARFWLCSRNEGLIQFDPELGVVKRFSYSKNDPKSFPDNHITDLVQLNEEEYLVSSYNQGIIQLNIQSGEFQEFANPDLQNARPTSIALDRNKTLWVGTMKEGIKLLDLNSSQWIELPELAVFSSSQIHGLIVSPNGKIWVSSDLGISSITPGENGKFELFHYQKKENSPSPFNPGAFTWDRDLGIFFGGFDRILNFRQENIQKNTIPPKVILTKISSPKSADTPQFFKKFRSDENDLTFHFSSMVFSAPEKNQYQFRLLGYDDSWKNQQGINTASYTNLDPGEYSFEVRGSNYDGVWNPVPTVFNLEITPPWYRTRLAYFLYLTLILTIVTAVISYLKWKWSMKYKLETKNQEAVRLREIDQIRSEFFSNISHELRTPLTLIMGPTERLLEDCENPIKKSQLKLISENAQKLLALTEKILSIRKISGQSQKLKIQKGNLGLVIQSVLINFHYLWTKKNLSFRSKVPLIAEVWYDLNLMERIVENLIHYVIQNAKSNSIIDFEARLQNKRVCILLNYTPSSSQKQYRAKNDTPTEPFDTDQSLKIKLLEKLIESHRGEIQQTQDYDTIRSLTLEFPVDKYAYHPSSVLDDEDEENIVPKKQELTERYGDQIPKILIVEDNKSLRNFLVQELCDSYQIIEASDGKSGIYEAYKHIPDLIVTDIMMPEIDGLELCRELKNNELTSHIPIVILTAKTEEETLLMGLELGADDFIQKPFSSRQLVLRIEKLIELRKRLRIRYSKGEFISPGEVSVNSADEKFLKKIKEIVESDFFESSFSVDDFSKKVGMSRMQLHRKLIALTGFSASSFIRDQRLRKGILKLETTDETVSEIAYSVGFSSPSYFIKCFRDTYQMTPLEYQQSKKD